MQKKLLGYVLGASASALFALPLLVASSVSAAPEGGYFGGSDPRDFADTAGLGNGNLPDTIARLIQVFIGFLGIVAVCIILFGGFKWMTAAGNEEKVGEAKRLIISGIIGMAIIFSSYAIATFVLDQLSNALTE